MLLRACNQDGISTSSPFGGQGQINSFSIKASAYASVGACMKARRDDPPPLHSSSASAWSFSARSRRWCPRKTFWFLHVQITRSRGGRPAGQQQEEVAQTQPKSQIRARRARDEGRDFFFHEDEGRIITRLMERIFSFDAIVPGNIQERLWTVRDGSSDVLVKDSAHPSTTIL
jgi:hypothetical protein